MAFHSTYTCPPGMTDALFQHCADWATRMDRAVMYREPVPMEEPPVLYDTFRRVNSQCIDPVLAVSFQRHQRNAELARAARESYAPPVTPAAASPMVPLDAVSLMFEVTQSLVDSAQREGRWQAQNTIQALTRMTNSSAPTRGYQQCARNRQYRAPNIAPYRPRNFDHHDREPDRAPHAPRGRRARFLQDDPPSYRRDRRPFEPTSPAAGPPRSTPHPRADFLFRGVPDEDHVMREETPAPVPDPLAVTPRPIINTIDLRTPEPIIIDDSERGTQVRFTGRPRTNQLRLMSGNPSGPERRRRHWTTASGHTSGSLLHGSCSSPSSSLASTSSEI